jgi:nuclear pore complex protein Nup107
MSFISMKESLRNNNNLIPTFFETLKDDSELSEFSLSQQFMEATEGDEKNTWILLDALLSQRKEKVNVIKDQRFKGTDRDIATEFLSIQCAEERITKEWLEKILPPPPEIIFKDSSFISQRVDPDFLFRQGKIKDELKTEKDILKGIFDYIRRGDMENAIKLCKASNQHWRACSIQGGVFYSSPLCSSEESFGGNRNRGLWMYTCFVLANQNDVDPFERAIYASFCGNTLNILPVCQTWEDHLWAYFQSIIVSSTENHLKLYPRLAGHENIFDFKLPEIDILDKNEVFSRIKNLQGKDFYKSVQKAIILDEYNEFFEEFYSSKRDVEHLRFVAHLVIVLNERNNNINPEYVSRALCDYIDILSSDYKEYVALYASKLPFDLQVLKYAQLLAKLKQSANGKDLICIAIEFGLSVNHIAKETFNIIARNTITASNNEIEPGDLKLIYALEWLLLDRSDNEHILEFLFQCNYLYRRFLLAGKLNAACKMYETLENTRTFVGAHLLVTIRDYYDYEYENFTREYMYLCSFFKTHIKYNDWMRKCSNEKVDIDLSKLELEISDLFYDLLNPVANSDLSWLRDSPEFSDNLPQEFDSKTRKKELENIRRLYIPSLFFDFHNFLCTSKFIVDSKKKSLQLAELVADFKLQHFKDFSTSQIQNFLKCVFSSIINGAIEISEC